MSDITDDAGAEARQKDALARLDQAVARFDVVEALQALHDSNVLDGLFRRLQCGWPGIRNELDYHHIIAAAVDELSAQLDKRQRVREPVGFIWTIAERRACDEIRRRRRETPTDPQAMMGRVLPVLPADPNEAIQAARQLLPRIVNEDQRAVLALVLDAMERGQQYLSAAEIAETLGLSSENLARQLKIRAFDRLTRLAREERLAGRDFSLPEIWGGDDDELLVEPDSRDDE
jgi:DNA-directed RNA polymerase specialized sigma24 family protein